MPRGRPFTGTIQPCIACGAMVKVSPSKRDFRYCSMACKIAATTRDPSPTDEDRKRFWSKVQVAGPEDCWLWTGSTDRHGYGKVWWRRRGTTATKVSWELAHGSMPTASEWMLHRCDTPGCVNPAHLFIGDQSENMKDAASKQRTARGERNGCAKLTTGQVAAIRQIVGRSQSDIAREFGVSQVMVGRIQRGQAWARTAAEHR